MAAQTLTDVTRNYDEAAISGLLNGEAVTLNNSNLIINSDVRWGQQAAVVGSMTISATLGGSILIDGRDVLWIPFDASSGNVPILGTVGVNDALGSIAGIGEFLGIFSALGTSPLAAGVAIPSSGFLKLRRATVGFADNEVITLAGGGTITVNSATGGRRGWIHVVGAEAATITLPRLGSLIARGDWFELGTTNGADDQTFQFPVLDNCPAIQIETAPGSNVYEWFLNAGARWGTATIYVPTNEKGKYFGMDNATGIITIARRATNACGFKPPSGCRVRIPNIILSSSTNANWNLNTLNATLATRYDFTTTSAGAVDMDKVSCNWYISTTSAFSVSITNSSVLQQMLVSNIASTTTIDNVAIGLNSTTEFTSIVLSNLFSGGLLRDIKATRYAAAATGNLTVSVTDCEGLNFVRTEIAMFGSTSAVTRGNAAVSTYLFTRANNFSMVDCSGIGGRLEFSQCSNIQCNNFQYSDTIFGNTTTTNPIFAIACTNATINVNINGFSNFLNLANQQPRSGILFISNAYSITLRNIGTPSANYDMGSSNPCLLICNAATATNLIFRRLYTFNTGTSPFTFANTVQGVVCDNVWGDGADSQAIAALNITPRGCRWTYSTTGQASVYGRHWEDSFISTTAGRIVIAMNEPLAATSNQVEIVSGTPAFTSGGQIAMRTLGDQVIWNCPYFILGYTSLANLAPIITGTNTGNFLFEYQINTGSGFSAWKTLNASNLFAESISPSLGFQLRVRATVTVANSTNALTYIAIQGVTDAASQQTQYPLPFDAVATVAGIIAGSRIQIYNLTTNAEIRNEVVSGTTFSYGYYNGTGITPGDVIRIRLAYVSGANARLPQEIIAVASSLGFSALASQELDSVYNTNGISGSSVTELTSDYPNLQIDSNDVDGQTTVQRIYAWFVNNRATALGIEQYFDAMVAEDLVNYRIKASIVNLKIDNVISTPLQIIGGRIYRDDGDTVIAATSNSIQIDPDKAYGVEVGTSGLTVGESATLNKLNTLTEDVSGLRFTAKALEEAPAGGGGGGSGPTASEIADAVRTELGTELGRIDASVSSRLASSTYTAPANADIVAIKAKTDQISFSSGNINAIAQIVNDKTGYSLTSAERQAIATVVEQSILNESDGQAILNAIVGAIGNTNIDQIALVAAIRADIERAGGTLDSLPTLAEMIGSSLAKSSDISSAQNNLANEININESKIDSLQAAIQSIPTNPLLSNDLRLNFLDEAISSRLPTSSYATPPNELAIANAVWTSITRSLTADVTLSTVQINAIAVAVENAILNELDGREIIDAIVQAIGNENISAISIANAIRTELTPELNRIDQSISSRSSQNSIDQFENKLLNQSLDSNIEPNSLPDYLRKILKTAKDAFFLSASG